MLLLGVKNYNVTHVNVFQRMTEVQSRHTEERRSITVSSSPPLVLIIKVAHMLGIISLMIIIKVIIFN